jgi:hypothetical protein
MWTESVTTIVVEGAAHQLPGVPAALDLHCESLPGDGAGLVCTLPGPVPDDAGAQLSAVLDHLTGKAAVLQDMIAGQMTVSLAVQGFVDDDRTHEVAADALQRAAALGVGLALVARTRAVSSEDELADALGW